MLVSVACGEIASASANAPKPAKSCRTDTEATGRVGTLRPTAPKRRDRDRDGLRGAAERRFNTSPRRADSDSDRLGDGYEARCSRTDPARSDTDADGLVDGDEVAVGLDPRVALDGPVVFVDDSGSDANPGTLKAPLGSIPAALQAAESGGTVLVMEGTYPGFQDRTARSDRIDLVGLGSERPVIEGATLAGAQHLRFSHLSFSAQVMITDHPILGQAQPAAHIALNDCEVGAFTEKGIVVRDGSADVTIQRCHIHDVEMGIAGPPGIRSEDIVIASNVIENLLVDGIQFASWTDVSIHDNVVRHMDHQDDNRHNDGIQVNGDAERIAIVRNRVYDSIGQLVLIGGAGTPEIGPIDDVLVENNVLHGCGAWAIQNRASNARYVHNTIWDCAIGGLVLPRNSPTDAVVVGNIIEKYGVAADGVGFQDYNLYGSVVPKTDLAAHEIVGVDPGFQGEADADFSLTPASVAHSAGDLNWAPATDLTGKTRGLPPTLGALE